MNSLSENLKFMKNYYEFEFKPESFLMNKLYLIFYKNMFTYNLSH